MATYWRHLRDLNVMALKTTPQQILRHFSRRIQKAWVNSHTSVFNLHRKALTTRKRSGAALQEPRITMLMGYSGSSGVMELHPATSVSDPPNALMAVTNHYQYFWPESVDEDVLTCWSWRQERSHLAPLVEGRTPFLRDCRPGQPTQMAPGTFLPDSEVILSVSTDDPTLLKSNAKGGRTFNTVEMLFGPYIQ